MTLSPGTLLNNRYRILSILGQGGMGAVYHAIDENLGVAAAVKENLFLTDEYARQFQREASILANLRHPNLPRVGDYFTLQGQGQYLIMDYIEGEDLRMRLERLKQLPEKEVILIGVFVCEALAYLHSRKPPVVHRDIKPGNIKITPEGEIILVDFGLAKVMTTGQATTTGARAMTPGYSPPEQYGTARTDSRSDIYSLGATLYAALTGVIPEDSLARATGKIELTPIRSIQPKISRKLAMVIEKAMAVEADQRYQSAEIFRNALMDAGNFSSAASLGQITVPPPVLSPDKIPSAQLAKSAANNAAGSNGTSEAAVGSEPPTNQRLAYSQRLTNTQTPTNPFWSGGCLGSLILLVLIAAGLTTVLVLRPDFPNALMQQILPTATSTSTLTPTPIPPTETLSPTSTSTPEPTIPPTLTPTPTIPPATFTPSPTPLPVLKTTPVGGSGQIAFSSNRTGAFEIWVMNGDGTGLVQISHQPGGACQAAWSPDGEKIAFVSPCQPRNDTYPGGRIYVMNSDGTGAQPLPLPGNLEGDFNPTWSPDGKQIMYTSVQTGRLQIYLYDFGDNTTKNLSNSKSFDFGASWSPDGKTIAFVRQILTNQIWLMNNKGENQIQFNFSATDRSSQWPAWTPDGQLILFSQNKVNLPIPWLMAQRVRDQNTNQEFRVPPTGQDISPIGGISVSPDGLLIAYESWPDGKNHDIFLMTINGAKLTALTTESTYEFGPAWRPRKTSQ